MKPSARRGVRGGLRRLCLHPISHRFQVIADYWSNLRFREGVPLFNIVVRGETLHSRPRNLASRNYRNIAISCGAKHVLLCWTV